MTNKNDDKVVRSTVTDAHQGIDDLIAGMVSNDDREVPLQLKQDLHREIRKRAARKTRHFPRLMYWLPVSLVTAAIFVLLVLPAAFAPSGSEIITPNLNEIHPPVSRVNEIRTEIQLKKKKIKILWFHKGKAKPAATDKGNQNAAGHNPDDAGLHYVLNHRHAHRPSCLTAMSANPAGTTIGRIS